MAKLRMGVDEALRRLIYDGPKGAEIHRAWVDGGDLVIDLRGSEVPDVEEIDTAKVESRSTCVMVGQKTVYVPKVDSK